MAVDQDETNGQQVAKAQTVDEPTPAPRAMLEFSVTVAAKDPWGYQTSSRSRVMHAPAYRPFEQGRQDSIDEAGQIARAIASDLFRGFDL